MDAINHAIGRRKNREIMDSKSCNGIVMESAGRSELVVFMDKRGDDHFEIQGIAVRSGEVEMRYLISTSLQWHPAVLGTTLL